MKIMQKLNTVYLSLYLSLYNVHKYLKYLDIYNLL